MQTIYSRGYEEKNMHPVLVPIRVHKLSFPADTDTIFYLHWHQEFEFFMVTSGSARFTIEDRSYTVRQGECIFIRPNQMHAAYGIPGEPCEFTAFVFFDSILTEYEKGRFYQEYISPVLHGKVRFAEHIVPAASWQQKTLSLLHELISLPVEQLADHELLIKSHLLGIWHYLSTHRQKSNSTAEENPDLERLQPVIDYIHEHYMYDISLSDLASVLPMSEGQFCRYFKKWMHYSPISYVMRYRILQSCTLLTQTDKKIAEIANLTGFNNISYFNKTFHTIIGCQPSYYRKNSHNLIGFI